MTTHRMTLRWPVAVSVARPVPRDERWSLLAGAALGVLLLAGFVAVLLQSNDRARSDRAAALRLHDERMACERASGSRERQACQAALTMRERVGVSMGAAR